MENLSVVDLTAEPAPLAAVERLASGAKAVMLSFPPARDAREFGRLSRAVKRAKVVAVIAHPLFGRPGWAKIMEWLASGVLGSLERLDVDLCGTAAGAQAGGLGQGACRFAQGVVRLDRGLWPALDFALRLPSGLPPLCFHEKGEACELCSVADPASVPPRLPRVRLSWRLPGNGGPTERLLIQAANGRLELVAGPLHVVTVRMVLASGHEVAADYSEVSLVPLPFAWARHAVAHGLDGGPLALSRLASLYDWLARR